MKSFNIISSLWLLTCLAISGLGIILKGPGPTYNGGIYYIGYSISFLLLCYVLHRFDKLKSFELPLRFFIIGVVIILFSEPLFENDHYRYLWEGNAFFRGENPYLHAPNNPLLDHLIFAGRERIGFSHLTTVYPPLGIIWFGIGGVLGLEVGLRVLMLLNAVLVYLCFMKLKTRTLPWMLVALFPIFTKEFIQAIHIDLLAAFFFLLFMIERREDFKKRLIFVLLSIWTKVLGVAGLPFLIFLDTKSSKDILKRIFPIIIVAVSLPLFLEWFVGLSKLMGLKQFTIDWIWNPGFYSILTRIFDLFDEHARRLTGIFFATYIGILSIFCLRELIKKKWTLDQSFCVELFYLIFSGLMFFTPVYNGWYAIWFLFPALLLKLNFGVLYGVFSTLCYVHYGLENYHYLGEIFTHIWFPISVLELLVRRRTTRSAEHTEFGAKRVI